MIEVKEFGLTMKETVTHCVICQNNRLQKFAQLPGYSLFKCSICNTLLRGPSFGDSHAAEAETSVSMDNLVDDYESIYKTYRRQTYKRILRSVTHYQQQGNCCLDIGCATGWFLEMAAGHGWECYGVDLSGVAIGKAKRAVPAGRFEVGTFSNEVFANTMFDLITLLDVLEHIADPIGFLRVIWQRLNPNGLFVVRVPLIDSLIPWSAELVYSITRGKYKKPLSLLYHYHVIGFSTASLYYSLSACGFQGLESWRENSIDPKWLSQKAWARSAMERVLTRMLLFAQTALGLEDEMVVVARRLQNQPGA